MYNVYQDEFGFKEGNDYFVFGGGYGDYRYYCFDVFLSILGEGYGRQGVEYGYGDQSEEIF